MCKELCFDVKPVDRQQLHHWKMADAIRPKMVPLHITAKCNFVHMMSSNAAAYESMSSKCLQNAAAYGSMSSNAAAYGLVLSNAAAYGFFSLNAAAYWSVSVYRCSCL